MQDLRHDLLFIIERLRLAGERKLPSERNLAQQLGVSRGTLRRELGVLAQEGRIVRRTGRGGGSFIRETDIVGYLEPVPEPPLVVTRCLDRPVGVPTILVEQGHEPGTTVLFTEERPASFEERAGLQTLGGQIVVIRRLRSAGGTPLSLEEMMLPADLFPGILDHQLGSIYALMRKQYDVVIDHAEESIAVGSASPAAALLLNVVPGAALYDIRRTAYDQRGRRVEVSRDLFRADITRLTVTSK
ncbi:GntR family transcriptional regulator [Rothia uropygialis]|uniref:GntR family transcriptional regulator n=1 Tax=Kocuria sp. 36 TaxID=1415402 RepID=UPI00101BD6B6|nr:GntR family transcriptional regulator [Kocuria sp. 36]